MKFRICTYNISTGVATGYPGWEQSVQDACDAEERHHQHTQPLAMLPYTGKLRYCAVKGVHLVHRQKPDIICLQELPAGGSDQEDGFLAAWCQYLNTISNRHYMYCSSLPQRSILNVGIVWDLDMFGPATFVANPKDAVDWVPPVIVTMADQPDERF